MHGLGEHEGNVHQGHQYLLRSLVFNSEDACRQEHGLPDKAVYENIDCLFIRQFYIAENEPKQRFKAELGLNVAEFRVKITVYEKDREIQQIAASTRECHPIDSIVALSH